MFRQKFTFSLLLLFALTSKAQVKTGEDSVLTGESAATYLGGYGNAFYQNNSVLKTSHINLERVVFFAGHRFNEKFSFFSEIEIEDAKVAGGEEGGEIAVEQAYLRFRLNRSSYLTAGLFLPRIGILNENHLPNTFNGNERTQVETLVVPSTWRELGVGFYTTFNNLPLEFSAAVVNGLNSSGFSHGSVIREGRFEGRQATANNIATQASLLYSPGNFTFQVSGYYGGTVGFSPRESDSLNLDSGPFGTPVMIGEADARYHYKAVSVKILGTLLSIPDADKVNRAFANNTPESAYGFYAEAAYDLLYTKFNGSKSMSIFLRYEKLNLNSSIPDNGIKDEVLDQNHLIAGITYLPVPQIAIKADVRFAKTGEQNPELIINPDPNAPPFLTHTTFVNIGFGFSF